MKNLVKFFNILNSTFSNKRRYVRGKRSYPSSQFFKNNIGSRYNFSKNLYSLKTTPQRYGPGVKYQNIEFFTAVSNNVEISFNNIFSTSPEHTLYKTMYNYFKVLNVAVIFPQQEASVNSNYLVFQVNWNNGDTYGIQFEENNKWVPLYRTKDICYKFIPPDIPLILGTTTNPIVINLNNYMRTTDQVIIPGSIFFKSNNDAATAMCRVVIKVEYRGSKLPDSSSLQTYISKFGSLEKIGSKIILPQIKNKVVDLISEVDNVMRENNNPPLKSIEPLVIKERVPEIIPRREYIGTITHSVAQAESKDTKGDVFSKGFPDYCLIGKETLSLNKREDTGGGHTFSRK